MIKEKLKFALQIFPRRNKMVYLKLLQLQIVTCWINIGTGILYILQLSQFIIIDTTNNYYIINI